jgi:hypothetical protein
VSASACFDWVCDRVTERTELSRSEARGLLRVVLRDFGFSPERVTRAQLTLVITRSLASAMARVKVPSPKTVCEELARDLANADIGDTPEDAAAVFARLGRKP